MAVYCTNVNEAERKWLENFEAESGFEPMHQDDLDAGEMSFGEVARANLQWFQTWSRETYLSVATYPDEYIRSGHGIRKAA